MYTFTVVRAEPDHWWVVALSWGRVELIVQDDDLAKIVQMKVEKMRTELVRYYGAELYETGGTYWESEYEAKKCIETFFQPRMLAYCMAKN